jgi:nitrous oxidase accessory protein NosD
MRSVRIMVLPLLLLAAAAALELGVFSSAGAQPAAVHVHCDRNVPAGANLAAAIGTARGGATLCLAAGSYGPIEGTRLGKQRPVTLRPAPGARVEVDGADLIEPAGLRIVGLHFGEGISISPAAARIEILDNEITGSGGIYLFGDYRIGKRVEAVRIEGNTIHDVDYGGEQETGYGYGIEGVGDVRHMTIRDNTIQSTASDYIQSATPVHWVVDRNTFLGPSLLADHEDHQDLWQIFGGGRDIRFTDNVARHTGTQESLLFQEGTFRRVVVENNLFDHDSRGYTCQIYQSDGLVFRDNTVVGSRWGCLFRDLAGAPPGSGYRVERNVFVETSDGPDVSTEGRAAGWGIYDYNVSSDGSAAGPHSLRRWKPAWGDTTSYQPLRLPFPAGYAAP